MPLRPLGEKKVCTIAGCGLLHEARGMCKIHYNEWHRSHTSRGRYQSVRRARKRAAGVFAVSPGDIERLVQRHHGMCAYCRQKPWEHLDHVVPLSRGGRHSIGNLLPACSGCNCRKSSKFLIEWKGER